MRFEQLRGNPLTTYIVLLVTTMVLTLLLLLGAWVTALEATEYALKFGGEDVGQVHAEVLCIFGAGALLMIAAIVYLGAGLVAETRRRTRLELATDLDELRTAQEELQVSHERYRDLADSLPQAVFETDAEGRMTFANRVAFEVFGYSDEDLARGATALQMVTPPDRQRAQANLRRRLRGEVLGNHEYEMLRADGTTFSGIVYADVIVRGGEPVGMRGTIADITDRKAEERRLQERLLLEKAVSRASSILVSDSGSDLDSVAAAIGEALSVNCVYVLRFGDDGAVGDLHTWSDGPLSARWAETLERIGVDSLPGWTQRFLAGEDVVIADADELDEDAAHHADLLRECGIRAAITVPIQSASGELIGLIGFDDTTNPRNWDKEEGRLLRLIAQRLAIYWQRVSSEEELLLTNARLELLNSVSQGLNAGASLSDAIQHSCDGLKNVLGYHYVELFLPGPADSPYPLADGVSCHSRAYVQSLNGPLVGTSRSGRLYEECEMLDFMGREEILPLICDLAPPGEQSMPDLAPQIFDILGVEYICQVPLLCEGEVMGYLVIGTPQARPLPEREKRFLAQFAEQLALIVAKARAEEALRDKERRYRQLFNSGNDAMYVHYLPQGSQPGRFVEVNDVACSMLGYTREQFRCMSPADLDAPLRRLNVPRTLEELEVNRRALYETVHMRADGRTVPVEINAHLFELDGGPAVLSIARDITARRQSEDRLQQANECFLGFTADPMENIARLTELCGTVLRADWAAYVRLDDDGLRLISGWHMPEGLRPPSDPAGCICDDVMRADAMDVVSLTELDRSDYAETDANVRDAGACSYLGKAVHAHDGTPGAVCSFYRGHFEPSEEDERLIGIIASAIRIEEERMRVRDEREEALVELKTANRDLEMARSEAEEANRLKSEFLANTSHEIRTPLNGIIGYLQLVLNGLYDSRAEEREFLEGAAESAHHLLALINDVLDVAKIEAGKLRVEPEAVNVASVLADIHSLVRVQSDQNALKLVFHPVDEALTAWCDEERLKQVLINLVGNAIRFTSEGGSVTVGAEMHDQEGAIRFWVADTGIGIPPEKLDRIFEKFVQADGSTTRQRGGSGLGLTISRHLTELMGGALGCESEGEGKGSTFFFTIPLHRDGTEHSGDRPPALPEPVPDDGRPLVVVVEDDPQCRDYLLRLLDACGCATLWAATADDAMALLDRNVPGAVTIDYSLPAREGAHLITGWDLLVELQKDARFEQTALILVTGDTEVLLRRIGSETLPDRVRVIDKIQVPHELPEAVDCAIAAAGQHHRARVLLADDDSSFCQVLERLLGDRDISIDRVRSGRECLQHLSEHGDEVDLLLLDLRMPEVDGYEVLKRLRTETGSPDLPVLVVTAFPEPETVDEQMLLAGGSLTRLLTKHEVLSDPSRLYDLIEQFTGAPHPSAGSGDGDWAPPWRLPSAG